MMQAIEAFVAAFAEASAEGLVIAAGRATAHVNAGAECPPR
jgi:hypothetical protein